MIKFVVATCALSLTIFGSAHAWDQHQIVASSSRGLVGAVGGDKGNGIEIVGVQSQTSGAARLVPGGVKTSVEQNGKGFAVGFGSAFGGFGLDAGSHAFGASFR